MWHKLSTQLQRTKGADRAGTEFEEFILSIDTEMRNGLRAEQALRQVVTFTAKRIREERSREP